MYYPTILLPGLTVYVEQKLHAEYRTVSQINYGILLNYIH